MDANQIEKLKAAALAATPQDLDSVQRTRIGGWADCPTCGGDGSVSLGTDYCNYDNAPQGVTFYGIGDKHVNAEAYYRAANPAAVLELIAEVERLRAAPAAGTVEKDAAQRVEKRISNILMDSQAEWGDACGGPDVHEIFAYRLISAMQQEVDAAIEAHTKAGKDNA